MKQIAIALKYARALFETSRDEGSLERVNENLAGLGQLEQTDPGYLKFLVSPQVLTEHKVQFLHTVFGSRLEPMTMHFLELLVHKGRIGILPEIVEVFQKLVEEHQEVLRARVFTAVPLSAEAERRLKTGLDRLTGKDVLLEKRVDPTVLGGVVVHLGPRILDGSLQNGLRILSETLHHAEVN
jgi:F-type H+-transporting ATPase subunit delta